MTKVNPLFVKATFLMLAVMFAGASCTTVQQSSSGSVQAPATNAGVEEKTMMKSDADGVMMKDGKMMEEKNGVTMMMKGDVMMNDGTKVMMDGKVMMKDGTSITMKEGDRMMMKDGKLMMDASLKIDTGIMMKEAQGSYEAYDGSKLSLANSGDAVLFFAASWCPTCREADANLKASAIPKNLHILKVDYDNSTELKKKYGVTYQHTYVQVDSSGNLIKKWSGSTTASEIAAQVQ